MEWNGMEQNETVVLNWKFSRDYRVIVFRLKAQVQYNFTRNRSFCACLKGIRMSSLSCCFFLRHQISSVEFRIKSCCVCVRFHVYRYTYCSRCQRNAIRLYVCIMLFFSSFIRSSVSFGFVLMYSRSFVYIIIQFIELRFYFNQFRQITLKYARSFNTWPCSRKPILTERRNNAEHGLRMSSMKTKWKTTMHTRNQRIEYQPTNGRMNDATQLRHKWIHVVRGESPARTHFIYG